MPNQFGTPLPLEEILAMIDAPSRHSRTSRILHSVGSLLIALADDEDRRCNGLQHRDGGSFAV